MFHLVLLLYQPSSRLEKDWSFTILEKLKMCATPLLIRSHFTYVNILQTSIFIFLWLQPLIMKLAYRAGILIRKGL